MIIRLLYVMVVSVLLFTVDGLGQNTWVKTFGGTDGVERGKSIKTTTDSGYVLTGFTSSNDGDFTGMNKGSIDIFVMKLNHTGDIVWKNIFGGSKEDYGNSITTTNDGGYVLTGWTNSNDGDFSGMNKGDFDIFVMKLDSTGDIVWKKTYGGSEGEGGQSITTTNDSGYILTGGTKSNDVDFIGMNKGNEDIFVLKLNSSGEIVWKRTFGGSEGEGGNSITTTNDGGHVLTGITRSNDGNFSGMYKRGWDIFVLNLNSTGDIVWKKTFGGSSEDFGNSIINTNDSGYVLTGYTYSGDGDFIGMNKDIDIYVIKLNSTGDIVWKKTFGGSSNDYDYGWSIINTNDSGYVLTGHTLSNNVDSTGMNKGNQDIYVIKLNKSGDIVWKKTIGGSSYEVGWSIITTIDSGYVLTGYTNSTDGDFSGMNKGSTDIFVMKLDSNGNLNNTTSINEFSEHTTTLSVYPNPFHNSTTISYKVETPSSVRIELLNTLGQIVEVLREDYSDIGIYQLPLNISTLTSGMYSVRMISGSMNEVVPVCVVR